MKQQNENIQKKTIRLNRFLAQCGIGSRRKCDDVIASGHVFCNGKRVTEMGMRINPCTDRIEYHGKQVKQIQTLTYLALYKPREVMVTARDPEARATVYDIIEKTGRQTRHLRYVGRLDYQSEGLLLLTNDGDLVHALTHPRFHIKKVYQVKVGRRLTFEEITALQEGVYSNGQLLRAGAVRELSTPESSRKQFWYEIDLFEGKNRQLRRMFETLGVLVGRIRRVQFGSVKLGPLRPAEIRPLSEREISALRNSGFRTTK